MTDALNLDWLISVDDHILEPPNLWVDRVAAKDRDRAPHMETVNGLEVWVYDGKNFPTSGLSAVVGKSKEEFSPEPLSYAEMRPGCYDAKARLEDMDRSGVLASLCFPTLPRFCGQLFMEASDREFGFECLQHYNDWLVEEWCGVAPGRYIPLMLIPMWDPPLAVKEMERMAAKGVTAFAFSENPEPLGLPTIHDTNRILGARHGGRKRAGDGGLHARWLVFHASPDIKGRALHGQPHVGRIANFGNDVGLAVQRPLPEVPQPEDRALGGRGRLDSLLLGAGRAGARQAAILGAARRDVHGTCREQRELRRTRHPSVIPRSRLRVLH